MLPHVVQGSCTWMNGDHYDGQWQDSRMHGRCASLSSRSCALSLARTRALSLALSLEEGEGQEVYV
jgi:hypothetical protein